VISDRKKTNALIAGLMVPGLGQMYNGELAKDLCFFQSVFILDTQNASAGFYFNMKKMFRG
jgi:hypothetical protein